MKKLFAFLIAAVGLVACEESVDKSDLCGKWKVTSISDAIDGVPDGEGYDGEFEGDVIYTFNEDGSYEIEDAGEQEYGMWAYLDSVLTMCPDELIDSFVVKLVSYTGDTLIHQSDEDTEAGLVSEVVTLVRVKEQQ